MLNESEKHDNATTTLGGWGQGSPIRNSDLLLLRKAIREGWPVSPEVQQTIMERLGEEIDSENLSPRRCAAIVKVILEIRKRNLNQ